MIALGEGFYGDRGNIIGLVSIYATAVLMCMILLRTLLELLCIFYLLRGGRCCRFADKFD